MKYRVKPENQTVYRVVNLAEKATADIAVLPDELGTISKAWLIRWAEWVAAGRPEINRQAENSTIYRLTSAVRNEFNPALHPRDPRTGQFVERSFDLPSGVMPSDIAEDTPAQILRFIDDSGGDIEAVLQDENVSIDGVPDNIDTKDELISHISDEAKKQAATEIPEINNVGVEVPNTRDAEELANAIPGMQEYAEEHLPQVPSNVLDEDVLAEVKDNQADFFDKAPAEVGQAVVGNMVAITSSGSETRGFSMSLPHQGTGQDGQAISIPVNDGRSITIHETAHTIHKTYGYTTEDYTSGNISFVDYDVSPNATGNDAVSRYMLSNPSNIPIGFSDWRDDVVEEVENFTPGEVDASSDAQDIIGTATGDTVQEQMNELVNTVNRAFFKQQVALDRHGEDGTREMVQKTGYSTKAASETFTMLHEVMNLENPASAIGEVGKLVDHHPEMLNAYLNIYEPSETVQEELERRGVL